MKITSTQHFFPDVDQIWALISHAAENHLAFPPHAMEHYNKKRTRDAFSRTLSDVQIPTLLAHETEEFIGTAIGAAPEGGVGSIIWLIVKQTHQGKGVGRELFTEMCTAFRTTGCHKIKLTAPSITALHFYEKMGMTVEGFHPNHWWGMDFWVLGKNLT